MTGADPGRRRWLALAAAGAALVPCLALPQAQGLGLARESAVKAAFLYRFGSFVEWPVGAFKAPDAPFVIGVFGDEAVASDLEQLTRGRAIGSHPVAVRRVRDRGDLRNLHILFVGGQREQRAREMVEAVRGPVLTVADSPIGGAPGPVLYFTRDAGRVRFGASLPAASARGIKLNAKLLAVAQQVEGH